MIRDMKEAIKIVNSSASTKEQLQRAAYFIASEYYRILKYERIGSELEIFIKERIEDAICL